ncbi:T-box-containing protein TBX6L-like [Daphnia pulex]|nr:T-box-containing protein TBX6L-like [Daphnia pulex]
MDAAKLASSAVSREDELQQLAIHAAGNRFPNERRPYELPPIGSAGSPYQLPPSAAAHHSASAAAMMAHRHLAAAASVKSDPNIKIELENAELWQQFHQIGTEMIITKLGRRMFPTLKVNLSGLDPNTKYFVLLDLVLADDSRFRFNAGWLRSGKAEPQWPSRIYTHPDSPATGAQWMKHEISFQKVKLTNNTMDQQGHLVLTSMHKYVPRIHVIAASDYASLHWGMPTTINTAAFNVCSFIAVTAYANDRMTQLKIDNNPFAKGFRENGQLRVKKRQLRDSSPENRKKSRPSSASSSHSSLNITDDECNPPTAPGVLQDPVTPPPSLTVSSSSPIKGSPTNFSIARLVGETTSPAPIIFRPEMQHHQPSSFHHLHPAIHPWMANQHHHHLSPYSSVFAPRLTGWPHHLPLIPMMHFSSMFQNGPHHLMMGSPGSTSLTGNPNANKLF